LLYVVAPGAAFSGTSTNADLPLQQEQTLTLSNSSAGTFFAEWYAPATAAFLGMTRATTANGNLVLPLPNFTEDLAGIVYQPPTLAAVGLSSSNGFQMRLDSETGGRYIIQKSSDLATWSPYLSVTNTTGTILIPEPGTNTRSFFRAQKGY